MATPPYKRGHLSRSARCFLAAAAVLVAASCVPPPGDKDYRDVYRLTPERKTFSAVVHLDADARGTSLGDERRLDNIVDEYMRRGDTSLIVGSPSDDGDVEQQSATTSLLARLVTSGVPRDAIVVEPGLAPASTANGTPFVLSFRGYHVQVPECGDWSGQTGFNPTNLPHTDFGCSYQRNIGLMLSDPGNLVRSPTPGTQDPQRGDDIIKKHRTGKPTEAEVPAPKK